MSLLILILVAALAAGLLIAVGVPPLIAGIAALLVLLFGYGPSRGGPGP